MFGKQSGGRTVAVVSLESGSTAVALLRTGSASQVLAYEREHLSLEDRDKNSLRANLAQSLASVGGKAVAEYAKSSRPSRIETCYCVVGAPWSRSFPGFARSRGDKAIPITDQAIAVLAKQALADNKEIDRTNLLDANVSRILLNGYPTQDPAGKRAQSVDIFTLLSDCDVEIKNAASGALQKMFPGAVQVWRSSARAVFAASKEVMPSQTCLVVDVGAEATDLISLRKGVLEHRVLLEQGARQMLSAIAKGKPPEETMSQIELLEKEQGETDASEQLRDSIAKAEPDFVHLFGEGLAKLATPRKLPNQLLLIAPPQLSPWLSRFFTRIDFTQFTSTAKPFSVAVFRPEGLPMIPQDNVALFQDPSLCIASNLVNMELSS